jgi:hypothetical protein
MHNNQVMFQILGTTRLQKQNMSEGASGRPGATFSQTASVVFAVIP